MFLPSLKDRWSDRPALGAWLFLREPLTAESAARMGYDYVCIDLQHGYASQVDALAMIQAAASAGTIPVVRVAWNDPTSIGHSLDAGALAVIVPMVNDAEQAARAVAACRYAPEGIRSFGALAALDRYSGDYVQQANAAVCCIPMIETAEAVDNLDEILSVPGIDGIYVGPVDLSLTLGLPPLTDHDDERFVSAIQRILDACERHGVVAGIHADADLASKWAAKGFRMITVGYDRTPMLVGMKADLAKARSGVLG
jgi:4-hydroxy-2-oxoheptanedioate aldolase